MEINPNSQQPTGSSLPTSALGNIQRPGEYLRQIRVAQNKELNTHQDRKSTRLNSSHSP